jgi:hypothetical protein
MKTVCLTVFALAMIALAIVWNTMEQAKNLPASNNTPALKEDHRGMPVFKGDRSGQPTQEDFENAAQWLLDRDKEREKDR